jgi:sn-glycerol 3-phosphate transport system substrate-binding protein
LTAFPLASMTGRCLIASAFLLALVPGSIVAAPATKLSEKPAIKAPAKASTPELVLRHGLDGGAASALSELVIKFNDTQAGRGLIKLETVSPGDPDHSLPTMALLDPTEGELFFGTRPRMQSLDDVMRKAGSPLAAASLLPQLADTVDDANGKLQALPMGMSVPVLYIDTAKFIAAGLDPNAPPKTWWDLQEAAGKLHERGNTCPLTTSHFSWVHLENLASQSGETFVTRTGAQDKVYANGQISVKHLALITSWQKSRYFHYFGAGREGDQRFLAGDCAMLTSSSAMNTAIRSAGMDVRVAPLPHHGDVFGERVGALIPDGLSLWVLAGTTRAQDQLISRFVRFVLDPENQRLWVKRSGFLPMTPNAIEMVRQSPGFDVALINAISARLVAPKLRGARIKSGIVRERFRKIFGEELEPVWVADRAPKEALDRTVMRMEIPSAASAKR